jgi:hypothetical protein
MISVATFLVYSVIVVLIATALGTSIMAFTLRRRFPEVWKNWGEPVEWLWLTKASLGRHVFGFLDSRAYRTTGDVPFILLCDVIRSGWYATLILFPVAFLLLIFSLV